MLEPPSRVAAVMTRLSLWPTTPILARLFSVTVVVFAIDVVPAEAASLAGERPSTRRIDLGRGGRLSLRWKMYRVVENLRAAATPPNC